MLHLNICRRLPGLYAVVLCLVLTHLVAYNQLIRKLLVHANICFFYQLSFFTVLKITTTNRYIRLFIHLVVKKKTEAVGLSECIVY